MKNTWPKLDYTSWSDTLDTLHQWLQIVGKIRLRCMPWQNHSWHTSLYVTPTGFSTQAMPYEGGMFQIDFDFIHHELLIHSTFGATQRVNLAPKTVAQFYKEIFEALDKIDLDVYIHPRPNELEDATPLYKKRAS